eukprot:884717-Alexandrium_andersonii.AAC.1
MATRFFTLRAVRAGDVSLGNLPMLGYRQFLGPGCRQGRDAILTSAGGSHAIGPGWKDNFEKTT